MTPVLERTVCLPYGTRLTFRFGVGFEVEWHEGPPRIALPRARRKFMDAYREARMSFDLDTGELECPAPRTRH